MEKKLSNWVTVPAGLLLLPMSLLCIVGSLTMFTIPNELGFFIKTLISGTFLAVSIWVASLSIRLIARKPRKDGGLISPWGLRIMGVYFLVIPFVSMVEGSFWEKPVFYSVLTVFFLAGGINFLLMARERSSYMASDDAA